MHSVDDLIEDYERNRVIVRRQAEGLSHEDSLLQPPGGGGNCLNWTIGHLIVYRDKTIRDAGGEPVLDEARAERYARESDPITEDADNVIRLPELLDLLDRSQARLADALPGADLEEHWKRFHFRYFHDTYHTGQTELLRSLAGFSDPVI